MTLQVASQSIAFWLLVVVFLIDSALNAGIAIVSDGFLLKKSPTENRTMYIAAGSALAGMVGGAASILAGVALTATASWQVHLGSDTFGNFHCLFATSLALRLISVLYALRIQEPESHGTPYVVTQLVGATPMRVFRFPVGLYRGLLRARPSPNHGPGVGDTVTSGADASEDGEESTSEGASRASRRTSTNRRVRAGNMWTKALPANNMREARPRGEPRPLSRDRARVHVDGHRGQASQRSAARRMTREEYSWFDPFERSC